MQVLQALDERHFMFDRIYHHKRFKYALAALALLGLLLSPLFFVIQSIAAPKYIFANESLVILIPLMFLVLASAKRLSIGRNILTIVALISGLYIWNELPRIIFIGGPAVLMAITAICLPLKFKLKMALSYFMLYLCAVYVLSMLAPVIMIFQVHVFYIEDAIFALTESFEMLITNFLFLLLWTPFFFLSLLLLKCARVEYLTKTGS